MQNNIFIPNKINVGFQNRSDTYTKQLAYIIYYDEKNVLRKETSWNSWRDKNIPNIEFENIPTSGFVLNKKVGGYCSGWNHRNTYVRIYDPRGFEFEIDVVNLLYILENTNSIKGKGLEGEFIYGFSGGDLILIPTSSPDYKEIIEYNKIVYEKNYIKAKDLIIGASYKKKDNKEYIYMGRFDYWSTDTEYLYQGEWYSYYDLPDRYRCDRLAKRKIEKSEKRYWFTEKDNNRSYRYFESYKSISNKFINCSNSECIENYAELFDRLERDSNYSLIDETKNEIKSYTFEEFLDKIKGQRWSFTIKDYKRISHQFRLSEEGLIYGYYSKEDDIKYISPEEIFNELKPTYTATYLKNGKLYHKGD